MATTEGNPARLLDLTRLLSRAGLAAMTGVDRVERAYLAELLERPEPCLFLIRSARGFLLLDRAGARQLARHIDGQQPWGPRDLLSRLSMRLPRARQQAEATARRLAIARCRLPGLARVVARHMPDGGDYLNTGHSNLSVPVLRALGQGLRVQVLLHDTIPLDHPQFQTDRSVRRFGQKLAAVAAHADRVIYNSAQSRRDAERHMRATGRCPPGLVAHLGLSIPRATGAALPQAVDAARPFFVALGTIEPRKNHALLLDLWEEMAVQRQRAAMPQLCILGSRGWKSDAFLQRLQESPLYGRDVLELPGLPDAVVAAMLQQCRALLFPSFAEGFGLPLIEAAALGAPVLCAPLPVYREFLGDYPVYLPLDDRYSWRKEIEARCGQAGRSDRLHAENVQEVMIPTWSEHFDTVLAMA